MQSDILLVIPAYNEELNIVSVVENIINNYPQYDYIVINDGSTDQTRNLCIKHHFNLIDYPINLGLSGAFKGGMIYAQHCGYKYVMQYDGDGQHNPDYIPDMVSISQSENADIVIGSRFVTQKKPWHFRMLGSRIIGLCIQLTTKQKIMDPTSGMRLYNQKAINILSGPKYFSPEPDTIAYFLRCNIKVRECQVDMNERLAGKSYLNITNSVKYMLTICFSILIAQWFKKRTF